MATYVYRFYNPTSGEHFYTPFANERNNLILTNPAFQYEGVGWTEPTTVLLPGTGLTPQRIAASFGDFQNIDGLTGVISRVSGGGPGWSYSVDLVMLGYGKTQVTADWFATG